MQNVVDVQNKEAQRQSGIAGTQQQAQAAAAGAYGGGRDAIMRAERERNLATLQNQNQAQGMQTAYQQAQQAQRQAASEADPTAQVILKTQMAETERKAAESQARMQLETEKDKQDYQLRIADLQRLVLELQSKYETQTAIDSNKNATQIAMADINNASRERVATINANSALSSEQIAMAREQNQTALEASHQAQMDIRQHGINIEQQAFQHQADAVKAHITSQQQSQLEQQKHQQAMQQQAAQAVQAAPTEPTAGLPAPAAPMAPAAPAGLPTTPQTPQGTPNVGQ
jgi:hypothetical protein